MRGFIYYDFQRFVFSPKCYKLRFYFWSNTSGKLKKTKFCVLYLYFSFLPLLLAIYLISSQYKNSFSQITNAESLPHAVFYISRSKDRQRCQPLLGQYLKLQPKNQAFCCFILRTKKNLF